MSGILIEMNEVTHLAIQQIAKKNGVDQKVLVKFFVEDGLTKYSEEVAAIFNRGVNFSEHLKRRKNEISDDLQISLHSFDPDKI